MMRMLIAIDDRYIVISDKIRWMQIQNQALKVCYEDGGTEFYKAESIEEITGVRGLLDRIVEQDGCLVAWLKQESASVA